MKRSIEEASNLDIADFHCRYLIVDDIWIPLAGATSNRPWLPA